MILTLYVVSVAADVLTSILALRRGVGKEGNVLRFAGRYWILVRIALAVLIVVLSMRLAVPDWILLLATVVNGAVAVWNTTVLLRTLGPGDATRRNRAGRG